VALFVQLRLGVVLDDEPATRIKQRIRTNLSPRHVPSALIQAPICREPGPGSCRNWRCAM
jgi:hypothetical protein